MHSIHRYDAYNRLGSRQVGSFDYRWIQLLTFISSIPGESPPPRPRACFGRDELIEKIVGIAETLSPIALIGPGGIGKTSIALAVLHHDRVKKRFGDDRRFIRCDQFPASCAHLLNRLSKVIGAGIENPEDLAPLRPFLSSREMILILDNAESILDPQGTDSREIYAVVEELGQFDNICLCLTSRISTIPPAYETLDIPTLSMEAARDTFHRIYKSSGQSDQVNGILKQLDFHPLSITLLATVGHHSKWDTNRLTKEWERHRTSMLSTHHRQSLAATIELSLASPMFQELGPDARELLGVIAFFPQGIDENNLEWLFPNLPDRTNIFDRFCILSLAYRSNGFVTMLAPLQDYLRPKDPASSPLLRTTKECYFHRLSVDIDPGKPGFEEARWIASEDVNVEHLLDVFASVDADSVGVWDACSHFMQHLYWHKRRLVTLGPKIEGLPDDHRSKPECLYQLSLLLGLVGNYMEKKRLLDHTLKLWRDCGDDLQVAQTLRFISGADRSLGLPKEGIEHAKEPLEIYKQLNNTPGQALSWQQLAWSLYDDSQLGAAEEAAFQVINLPSNMADQLLICDCHRLLGLVRHSTGKAEKAITHFETAIGIASSSNWAHILGPIHSSLAQLFFDENRFDDAHAHVERSKSHATDDPYNLGRAMELQATFWYEQRMLKEAKSEALLAADVYEKIGATKDVEYCRTLLRKIEEAASPKTDSTGEFPETVLHPTSVNSPMPA